METRFGESIIHLAIWCTRYAVITLMTMTLKLEEKKNATNSAPNRERFLIAKRSNPCAFNVDLVLACHFEKNARVRQSIFTGHDQVQATSFRPNVDPSNGRFSSYCRRESPLDNEHCQIVSHAVGLFVFLFRVGIEMCRRKLSVRVAIGVAQSIGLDTA
ncbi:hypothetical protein OUZ56_004942 [Daphnia magna]|uniref:Uncharacterized protein n=1 Tax=Daphnia magna TaxID=35525 RepID=A0ABQ9YRN9_9CRUS|nr:hypothetical protein OUZ56_004942 [Daphnia magna]